ncbi:hypothetical protein BJV74DRAFT_798055 [Russula compacta]|nr:hypothetical protein BJV74DRAFT_798055 [Russula compacta]
MPVWPSTRLGSEEREVFGPEFPSHPPRLHPLLCMLRFNSCLVSQTDRGLVCENDELAVGVQARDLAHISRTRILRRGEKGPRGGTNVMTGEDSAASTHSVGRSCDTICLVTSVIAWFWHQDREFRIKRLGWLQVSCGPSRWYGRRSVALVQNVQLQSIGFLAPSKSGGDLVCFTLIQFTPQIQHLYVLSFLLPVPRPANTGRFVCLHRFDPATRPPPMLGEIKLHLSAQPVTPVCVRAQRRTRMTRLVGAAIRHSVGRSYLNPVLSCHHPGSQAVRKTSEHDSGFRERELL